jgi:hypothetical protein
MNRVLLISAALLVFASTACAPAAPTVDPAQVQASAMAAAITMIAMTQAAIPAATETPIPSPTPLPSPTFPPLPTIAPPTIEPTKSAGDDCNHLFDLAATGNARSPVKINNLTKGSVNLSLGMWQKNSFGQCGYLGFTIPRGQSITVQMPQTGQGPCWSAYAWVNGPNPSTSQSTIPLCWNNTDKWTLDIGTEVIRLTPP